MVTLLAILSLLIEDGMDKTAFESVPFGKGIYISLYYIYSYFCMYLLSFIPAPPPLLHGLGVPSGASAPL